MKYLLKLQCNGCGHKYRKTVAVPEGVSLTDIPDPPCPNCNGNRRSKHKKTDFAAGEAPSLGPSNFTKAMDATAEIVMRDNHMTNLKDNLRAGDAMAPRLPPKLQSQADNFFGGGSSGIKMPFNTQVLRRQAMGGSLRDPSTPNVIEATHKAKVKPPINIIAETGKKVS